MCPYLVVAVLATISPEQSPRLAIGSKVATLPATVRWIREGRNGDMWFGSPTDGLYRARGSSLTRFTTRDGLIHEHIRDIGDDSGGDLIISTSLGVSRFDGRTFQTLKPTVSLWPGSGWKKTLKDVWLMGNSASGVYRYDGTKLYDLRFPRHPKQSGPHPNEPNGVEASDLVYSSYQDRTGDVWFGLSGWGVYRFDGTSLGWFYQRDLTETPTGGSFGIRAIVEDKSGAFWISNNQNRWKFDPSQVRHGSVHPLRPSRGLGMPASTRTPHPIFALAMVQDRLGNIWMVTYKNGVWKYDGRRVTRVPVVHPSHEIALAALTLDRKGGLWLGTHNAGVFRLSGDRFLPFPAYK